MKSSQVKAVVTVVLRRISTLDPESTADMPVCVGRLTPISGIRPVSQGARTVSPRTGVPHTVAVLEMNRGKMQPARAQTDLQLGARDLRRSLKRSGGWCWRIVRRYFLDRHLPDKQRFVKAASRCNHFTFPGRPVAVQREVRPGHICQGQLSDAAGCQTCPLIYGFVQGSHVRANMLLG